MCQFQFRSNKNLLRLAASRNLFRLNTEHAKHMEKKSCKKEVVSRVFFHLKENVLLYGSMM